MDNKFLPLFFYHAASKFIYGIVLTDFLYFHGYLWMEPMEQRKFRRWFSSQYNVFCSAHLSFRLHLILEHLFWSIIREFYRCCIAFLGFIDNLGRGLNHLFGGKEVHRKLDILVFYRFHLSLSVYFKRSVFNSRLIFSLSHYHLLWLQSMEISDG